jgi:hypothetical protein
MRIVTTPEARSMINDDGGLLFVRRSSLGSVRGAIRTLLTTTEPPPDAFDYQRFETKGFLVFLEPGVRPPRELHIEVVGWMRRRVRAFWNGCAFVV